MAKIKAKPRPLKNNTQRFKALFAYWCGRFRLPLIHTSRDNRFTGHLVTSMDEDGYVEVLYNTRNLRDWPDYMVRAGVFHEIGHVKNDLPYETEKEQIRSELTAETYALRMMKKYYPKDYKLVVAWQKAKLHRPSFRKRFPIHHQAFSQIKDYQ